MTITDLLSTPDTIPADAPFTRDQRMWLSGYLAALRTQGSAPGAPTPAGPVVNVLYGTQTGTAEFIADETVKALKTAGVNAVLTPLDGVTPADLAAMQRVALVVSTYGEGEMPDNAELFWDAVSASDAPRLDGVSYTVCALGDSGYDEFCQAGKLIDTRFEQLGGSRLAPRVDCDVDYEAPSAAWTAELVSALSGVSVAAAASAPAKPKGWGRRNPFPSLLAATRRLSGPGSAKDIRHHEFALADSGLTYAAGDALAVVPCNSPSLVSELLSHIGGGGDLAEDLRTRYEIVTPSRDLLTELARRSENEELITALTSGDKDARDAYLWSRDTLDLLRLSGVEFDVDEFVGLLKPLAHRAYSISSSPLAAPDRIHLTVASVRYRSGSRDIGGVCSTHLADRLATGASAGVFVQPNTSFRPPADDDAPMIMVGPGTGIAPFRAFLQERRERGASGKNWLFFGDQHREHDYLYADELEPMHADGLLTRLDLAFSRDQAQKVYVQNKMLEGGAELWSWLQDGGHFYVCGDATHMARDVDTALHDVVAEHGGLDPEAAQEYVNTLKREKRYVRDVY